MMAALILFLLGYYAAKIGIDVPGLIAAILLLLIFGAMLDSCSS